MWWATSASGSGVGRERVASIAEWVPFAVGEEPIAVRTGICCSQNGNAAQVEREFGDPPLILCILAPVVGEELRNTARGSGVESSGKAPFHPFAVATGRSPGASSESTAPELIAWPYPCNASRSSATYNSDCTAVTLPTTVNQDAIHEGAARRHCSQGEFPPCLNHLHLHPVCTLSPLSSLPLPCFPLFSPPQLSCEWRKQANSSTTRTAMSSWTT